MGGQKTNEKPEIYAIRQDSGNWQISRRDFLKAAGIGAVTAGLGSRLVRPAHAEDLLTVCKSAPAHKYSIWEMRSSPDGNYLITWDGKAERLKCWDFSKGTLVTARDDVTMIQFNNIMKTARIGEKQYLFFMPDKEHVAYRELPLLEAETEKFFTVFLEEKEKMTDFTVGKNGDIYAVLTYTKNSTQLYSRVVCFERGEGPDHYQSMREIYPQGTREINGMALVHNDQELFIRFKTRNTILLDLKTGEAKDTGIKDIQNLTVMPDEDTLFEANNKIYYLLSLRDETRVWSRQSDELKKGALEDAERVSPSKTRVTRDGSTGVLLGSRYKGTYQLWVVSMSDGAYISHMDLGVEPGNNWDSITIRDLEISADGSRLAVAVEGALLLISLPDLKLIGCPVDVDEMTNDLEGMEISAVDPSSGETLTYTLPSGAEIPAGAVCTCNCVTGRGGAPCECDGYTCRCVGFCVCDSHVVVDRHYWYPN